MRQGIHNHAAISALLLLAPAAQAMPFVTKILKRNALTLDAEPSDTIENVKMGTSS